MTACSRHSAISGGLLLLTAGCAKSSASSPEKTTKRWTSIELSYNLRSHGEPIEHNVRVQATKFVDVDNSLQQEVCSEQWQVSMPMQSS